ncbi:hypothetical protein [Bradyrhizobium neotropicale]|uniref:hypothetical protein n=1 Tax=Bradyrhizobium neotropicale TaxID=1497615 RepID=UPI001AD638B3|nr:hypothetical protein [Bradyrhizobium neotropicale]MBO4224731.1 hypothetical protein [Bradyrhizobium neotropicale]
MTEFVPINLLALLIGAALVAVLAFRDFHLPYQPQQLRYAVSRRHYFLGAAVYIGASIIMFLLATGIVQSMLVLLHRHTSIFGIEEGEPQGIRQTSLVLSVLIMVTFPYLPGARGPFKALRRFAHELALYPKSIQLLITILATAPFEPRPSTYEQLEDGLARYSVPKGTLKTMISSSAVQRLEEAWSLRSCFGEIAKLPMFSGFLKARAATIGKLEVELQKLLRRTAKALLTLSNVERKQLRVVSQLVAEDCEALVGGYRTLLAEAAMSCVPGPGGREKLIRSFGYVVSLPRSLPYLPLVVAFGLDFALLLWPLIISPWVSVSTPFPRINMFSFALAHAICQTAAIAWAIYPKVAYDFARASPRKLPMMSYAVFGALSFLTGILVWTGLRLGIKPIPGMPFAEHPVPFILMSSLSFLFMTVFVSLLLDIRMRTYSYDYRGNRWRDAFILALALLGAAVLFQAVIYPYMPPVLRSGWLPQIYLGLTFLLGFVLGFFVPSVTAAYLQADEIIAGQVPSDADFLAQIKRRKSINAPGLQIQDGAAAPS